MRSVTSSSLLAVVVSVAFAANRCGAQRHPHFDDGGTLSWHTTLAAAKEAAKKADKLVFVEYGRAA